jgi:hypothetical protein
VVVSEWSRQTWLDAEPEHERREREEMATVAPDMVWVEENAGGWEGTAPEWPFARPRPQGLDRLLAGRRLRVRVEYSQAFPMVEPKLTPLDPDPPPERRVLHSWHLMGDGSLCLLQTADLWTGRETAADLVAKASGWFIEYLLMERGAIERMTESGIHSDDSLDAVIEGLPE